MRLDTAVIPPAVITAAARAPVADAAAVQEPQWPVVTGDRLGNVGIHAPDGYSMVLAPPGGWAGTSLAVGPQQVITGARDLATALTQAREWSSAAGTGVAVLRALDGFEARPLITGVTPWPEPKFGPVTTWNPTTDVSMFTHAAGSARGFARDVLYAVVVGGTALEPTWRPGPEGGFAGWHEFDSTLTQTP